MLNLSQTRFVGLSMRSHDFFSFRYAAVLQSQNTFNANSQEYIYLGALEQ